MRRLILVTSMILALASAAACTTQAPPAPAPSGSPSETPTPDPAEALRNQYAANTRDVCASYRTYRVYLLDTTTLAALENAKRDPAKGRQALVRWKQLLTDVHQALLGQAHRAQHPELKEVLTEESQVVATLLAKVGKIRGDGSAAWDLVLTDDYRNLGSQVLVTCRDLS